jgi:drug/metabolite transporter (DMT)-like permease
LKGRDIAQSILALIVFASAYALIRIALTELPPLTVGALRFILASTIMVPITLTRYRRKHLPILREDIPILVALSIVQIFLPNLLQNIGLEYTTASVSSVLQSTTPVFTLVLSFFLLREVIRRREILGASLGILGVTLLSTGGVLSNLNNSSFFGNVLQVGVAISYAISGILGKTLMKRFSALLVVTSSFVIGGILLSSCAAIFERNLWPRSLSVGVLIAVILLSFMYCLGLLSWYDVLQRTNVFQLYSLLFAMPVLAVVISVTVLHETFSTVDVIFSAITLLGVAVVQSGRNDT